MRNYAEIAYFIQVVIINHNKEILPGEALLVKIKTWTLLQGFFTYN
jgi:hypothetical protein